MAVAAGSLRQKHVEENRRRIRLAAIELFAEHGFDGTTVDAIAARADVSARTFFRYYATKEAVLFEDIDLRFGDLGRLIADRPPEETPFEALVAAFRDATAGLVRDPAFLRMLRRLAPEMAYLRSQRTAMADSVERELLTALARRTGASEDDLALRAVVAAVGACVDVAIRSWVEHGADGPFHPYLAGALDACTSAFSGAAVRS